MKILFSHRTIILALFVSLRLMGLWITLSSTNWFLVWAGLELNIYSFIPMILIENKPKCKEAAVKYFIPQAIGSRLILIISFIPDICNFITNNDITTIKTIILTTALLIKAGLPPLHQWFPRVMVARPWSICWFLSVPQKIAPILILNIIPYNTLLLISISALITMFGGLIIHNQTNLRTILAYSSIGQRGWIILMGQINHTLILFRLTNYILIITLIIWLTRASSWTIKNPSITNFNQINSYIFILQIFHLGGFPPLIRFFLKLWAINQLITQKNLLLLTLFLIGTLISLIFYIKIIIFTAWTTDFKSSTKTIFIPSINTVITTLLFTLSSIVTLLLILPLLLNLI